MSDATDSAVRFLFSSRPSHCGSSWPVVSSSRATFGPPPPVSSRNAPVYVLLYDFDFEGFWSGVDTVMAVACHYLSLAIQRNFLNVKSYSDSYWNENLCDGMGAVTQKYKISQAGNLQAIRVVQSSVLTVRSSMVIQILMSLSSSQMGV